MKHLIVYTAALILLTLNSFSQASENLHSQRQLISSGSKWEELAAYSRAVVDGDWIFISGTAGIDPATGQVPKGIEAQMDQIFRIFRETLEKADADLNDLVKLRCYIVDQKYVGAMSAKLHEYLADIKPANLTIVTQLAVPDALIEIEATAKKRN